MLPETFERCLQNYDTALSVRWGHVINCWVVERRCSITPELYQTLVSGMKRAVSQMGKTDIQPERYYMLQKICEEGYSAGYGRRVVIYTKHLDNRVFDSLMLTDLQNTGNLQKAINRTTTLETEKKRQRHNAYESLSREVVDVVNWGERKHSSEVAHGKAPHLVAEAFKREKPKGSRQHFDLLDAQGVPLGPKKPVKLELAHQ